MKVRLAEGGEDFRLLIAGAREFHEEFSGTFLPFDAVKTATWITRSIEKKLALIVDADNSEFAGALLLDDDEPRYSSAKALWDIGFYVLPKYRKTRAAALLRDAAKAIAEDMQMPLFLAVSSGGESERLDRLDKFFTRAGFERIGGLYLAR